MSHAWDPQLTLAQIHEFTGMRGVVQGHLLGTAVRWEPGTRQEGEGTARTGGKQRRLIVE